MIIFGDSWSFSSRKKLPNMIEGYGTLTFQQMFKEKGIQCINQSVQGSCNQDIVKQLINHLDLASNVDIAVIFQTDPLRDILTTDHAGEFKVETDTPGRNLSDLCKNLCGSFYNQLSMLQQQINKPILLIGGLSCLARERIPNNLYHAEKSWTELGCADFIDCFWEWVEPTLAVYQYKRSSWRTPLHNFIDIENQIKQKNYIWQTSDFFSWCHASDIGYKSMFNYVNDLIEEI